MSFPFVQTFSEEQNCWVYEQSQKPANQNTTPLAAAAEDRLTLKSPFLSSKSQIESLTSVNGLSIKDIERRARPGGYSQYGFLGENESFIDVLKNDWERVERLHVTHTQLADHLENIISLAKSIQNVSGDYLNSIEYRTKDLPGNMIYAEGSQKLEVSLLITRGYQEDIFNPHDDSQRDVNTPKMWSQEFYVKNLETGAQVYLNSGILSYIREFGFYEGGGEQNHYRVDPLKVMSILTGKSLDELKSL